MYFLVKFAVSAGTGPNPAQGSSGGPPAQNLNADQPPAQNPDADQPPAPNPDADQPPAQNPDADQPPAQNPGADQPPRASSLASVRHLPMSPSGGNQSGAQGQPLSNKRPREPEVDVAATPTPKRVRFLPLWLSFTSKPKNMVNGSNQPSDSNENDNNGSDNNGSDNRPAPSNNTQNDASSTSTDGHFKILDPNITIHPPLEIINEEIKKGCFEIHDLTLRHKEHGSVQFHDFVNLHALGGVTDLSCIASFRHGVIEIAPFMIGNKMTITLFNISRKLFAQQRGLELETVTDKELQDILKGLQQLAGASSSNYNEKHQMWTLHFLARKPSAMDKDDDEKSQKNKDNNNDDGAWDGLLDMFS